MMQFWGEKKTKTCATNSVLFIFTVVYWHKCVVVWILLHLQIRLHLTVLKINIK